MLPLLAAGLPWGRILAIVAIVAAVAGGYMWFNNFVEEKAELTQHLAEVTKDLEAEQYKSALERQNAAYYKGQVELALKDVELLNLKLNEIRKERDNAKKVLEDVPKLERAAAGKPGLVTKFAQRATRKLWSDFEAEAQPSSGSSNPGVSEPPTR